MQNSMAAKGSMISGCGSAAAIASGIVMQEYGASSSRVVVMWATVQPETHDAEVYEENVATWQVLCWGHVFTIVGGRVVEMACREPAPTATAVFGDESAHAGAANSPLIALTLDQHGESTFRVSQRSRTTFACSQSFKDFRKK